jgi:hypothetical protein
MFLRRENEGEYRDKIAKGSELSILEDMWKRFRSHWELGAEDSTKS